MELEVVLIVGAMLTMLVGVGVAVYDAERRPSNEADDRDDEATRDQG